MRKVFTIIIALVLCIIMTSCNATTAEPVHTTDSVIADESVDADESKNSDNAANTSADTDVTESPDDAADSDEAVNPEDVVALAYADPVIDMLIRIDGQDWAYVKSEDGLQVYFFLKDDKTGNNIISVSSQELTGEADKQIAALWDMVKESLNAENSKPTEIKAGQYKGVNYEYSLDFNGETFDCKYIFWSTDDRLYICTVSADKNNIETVNVALDSVLESFDTLKDKK